MTGVKTVRKQPRQSRSRATVDAILEAAARILETAGFDALNTNAIAAKAGVSIGSLYQYFPSRQVIVAELVRRERTALGQAVDGLFERREALSWAEMRLRLIRVAVDHQLARPRLARALEYAEDLLEMDETSGFVLSLDERLVAILAYYKMPSSLQVAQDLAALVRGIADTAGLRGEEDADALALRIGYAVDGYLMGVAAQTGAGQ
ncbi:MAG: TetR/AcrR family transcriptional regulator [Alphaproteobacteria bacterium]|nr:TetR/AcrR family transcriptional regulator [Alphaproteobacteria bacterium]